MSVKNGTVFDTSSQGLRSASAKRQQDYFISPESNGLSASEIDNRKENQKLDRILQASDGHLARCKSVFPFELFPDEITVDQHKVNVICREFFFSEDIHSILIKDLKDVEIESNPFFSKIKIVPDGYPAAPVSIKFLKKKEALVLRRIIQGLRVVQKEGVDVAKIDSDELKEKAEEIGKVKGNL